MPVPILQQNGNRCRNEKISLAAEPASHAANPSRETRPQVRARALSGDPAIHHQPAVGTADAEFKVFSAGSPELMKGSPF